MKWSYETISAMKWIIERMNNFYFYSDEMKLQWHIWHKFFFTPHQTVSVKENHWQQYFFPLLFQPNKKKISPNNLIVTIQLFFSPFLHFGNETAIIKLFFFLFPLFRQWHSHNSILFFSLLSPPIRQWHYHNSTFFSLSLFRSDQFRSSQLDSTKIG